MPPAIRCVLQESRYSGSAVAAVDAGKLLGYS